MSMIQVCRVQDLALLEVGVGGGGWEAFLPLANRDPPPTTYDTHRLDTGPSL